MLKFLKKNLHKILLILFTVFFPFLILLKKKNFTFVEIYTERIGHLALSIEPLIKDIKEKNNNGEKKKYLIFYNSRINNEFLFKISRRELQKLANVQILKGYFFWKYINLSYEFFTKKDDLRIKTGGRKNYHIFLKPSKIISLTNQEIAHGNKIIEKFGMRSDSKWICIHNRDSSYLKTVYPNQDWSYQDFRDFSVDDLKPAAEYFAQKGYFVLRIGKHTKEPLKSENPKIIDYSNSNYRSDFMDIFLLSKCNFYFGSPSGIVNAALLFRKPLFVVNMVPIEAIFSYKRREPCLFMRLLDKKNNKILSIREMIDKDITHFFRTSDYLKNQIKPINNSKEEILEFAEEAEKRINNNWEKKDDKDFKNLSEQFSNEIKKNSIIQEMFYDNLIGYEFLKKTKLT